jgi:hypothetical protein
MAIRVRWIQTHDSVLEPFSISLKEAIYEQHRVGRRLGCHCLRHLVIFWFALGHRLVRGPHQASSEYVFMNKSFFQGSMPAQEYSTCV